MTTPRLIAFTGYAGVGKDEAAKPLIAAGYQRQCFGDIIKSQLNDLIIKHFGFSAFTNNRSQKERIRPLLEQWGEVNYDAILASYLANLAPLSVNTRLVRVREAQEWVKLGGVIVEISKPNVKAATEWEGGRLDELRRAGLIHHEIWNTGNKVLLHVRIERLFGLRSGHGANGVL